MSHCPEAMDPNDYESKINLSSFKLIFSGVLSQRWKIE
jgi:hypothetical protein